MLMVCIESEKSCEHDVLFVSRVVVWPKINYPRKSAMTQLCKLAVDAVLVVVVLVYIGVDLLNLKYPPLAN